MNIFLNIFISILIIYTFHQLWDYLKNTFSTKITKDLANLQTQKYKQIIEEIQETQSLQKLDISNPTTSDSLNMEQELESFIESIN
jgi:hypothetical protein